MKYSNNSELTLISHPSLLYYNGFLFSEIVLQKVPFLCCTPVAVLLAHTASLPVIFSSKS